MNKPETEFILARYDELIEKVVKAEVRRKEMEEELNFIRGAFMAMMKRPVAITLTDEQVDKMVLGLSKYLADIIQQGKPN
jgi:hypothetical protein